MSRICPKCGERVPKFVWVDGKKRNCQRRKYCLKCSPFGEHNTSKLEERKQAGSRTKDCPDCGKEHDQKGKRCFACYFRRKEDLRRNMVKSIVGDACWFCGYNKTWRNIHFHHVDSDAKLFCLTTRELMLKWDRVLAEMKKCILVCGNCHGEIHEGIISAENAEKLWSEKWNKK